MQDEEEGTDYDLLQRVLTIRGKLEEKCMYILDLRFNLRINPDDTSIDDETPGFEEIGEKLGLTPDNARQRFKRCLGKLKEMVKNDSELNDWINS